MKYYVEARVKAFDNDLIYSLDVLADSFEADPDNFSRGNDAVSGPWAGAEFLCKQNAVSYMPHVCELDYVRNLLLQKMGGSRDD